MKFRARHGIASALLIAAAISVFLWILVSTGAPDRWLRQVAIRQIYERTGGHAGMGDFHLKLFPIRVQIDSLTVRGREAADSLPLFHAQRVSAAVRILSLFSRQFEIQSLIVETPRVAVQINASGQSNIPSPPVKRTSGPWPDTLFSLRIGDLELRNGTAHFNDQVIPLNVQGNDLQFVLHYNAETSGQDFYVGNLQMNQVSLHAQKWAPVHFDFSTKFVLQRNALEIGELVLKLPHSQLNLSALMPNFAQSDWTFKYRGRFSLADLRSFLRSPTTPDGVTDFSGDARLSDGDWTGKGYYRATGITMKYQWFHASGMETAGNYEIANRSLSVANLSAKAFGGTARGKLEMAFAGLAFRTETHLEGADLHDVLFALNNPSFPVDALHWDSSMVVDSVNTWNANFKHFRTKGTTTWAPPQLTDRLIPVTAQVNYDYSTDTQTAAISQSEITTPHMHLNFDGPISGMDSALEVRFQAGDLLQWNDFINVIRGPDASPVRITGTANWRGRVLGPIAGPTFVGHVVATHSGYEQYAWDSLEADMQYSADEFTLTSAVIQRAGSSAELAVDLHFDGDWGFVASSPWSLDVRTRRASIADLQYILGTKFPATGSLSGEFRGSGTRASPVLDANFSAQDMQAGSWKADRFSGQLRFEHDLARLTNAELVEDGSSVAGEVTYHPAEEEAEYNLIGSNIGLERIRVLQTPTLPVGGSLSFHLQGSGPLRTPTGQGTLTLSNLKLGGEVQGNFTAQVHSDGQNAQFSLHSQLARGQVEGNLGIGLSGDQTISGHLLTQNVDLDPLIAAAFHTGLPTAHSSVDGTFDIQGALRKPDTIQVQADVTKISIAYDLVQLSNEQDIRLTYRRNAVEIQQAHLHGTDTDFQISGSARFNQDRPLRMKLAGAVNLRLAQTLFPGLDAQGRTEINVSVEGTMARPRITGQATVHDAAAHYGDFPTGLTNVNGTLAFDKSQLLFENVTAEAGGGRLTLSGSLTYGEGPIRYQVRTTTSGVRIRYPVGMSWLASGALELSGDSRAAQISGQVQVQRLLFSEGVDVASFMASASQTAAGPPSSSTFVQNLSLDVEGVTTPGARIEWAGAHVEVDGDVRLRGTFDRPVLLGHVHLLSGEMPFRGNNYQLTRGDINFADPFRLDPDVNIEATTTIDQYQVTIDFTGLASRMQMNYRSDPPLPDADIIALLALGSPGQESALRSGTGAANYASTALLSEAISTGIGGRIEHLFGISSFRVDPFAAETATESNATARVTIRQQVTQNLAVTYSTNATTNNQYQLIQVEYAVKRNLSVVFLRDINGTYGLDIKFIKHIK